MPKNALNEFRYNPFCRADLQLSDTDAVHLYTSDISLEGIPLEGISSLIPNLTCCATYLRTMSSLVGRAIIKISVNLSN